MPLKPSPFFYSLALCAILIGCSAGNTSSEHENISNEIMSYSLGDSFDSSSSSSSSLSYSERFSKPEGWQYFPLTLFPGQILLPADTFIDSNIQAKKAIFALQKSPQQGIFIDEKYKREFKSLDDFILNLCVGSPPWQEWGTPADEIFFSIDWSTETKDLKFSWISEACLLTREQHISAMGNFGVLSYKNHYYFVEVPIRYTEKAQIAFYNMTDEGIPISK